MNDNCEQQARLEDWDLSETSACHISVMNSEMGQLRDAQLDMNYRITRIEDYMQLQLWLWSAIGVVIIGLVIKKMWGK